MTLYYLAAQSCPDPAQVGLPGRMGDRRGWVLSAQLYSVRSAGSWGVGDLTDLTDLAVWAGADLGADSVLVNPNPNDFWRARGYDIQ